MDAYYFGLSLAVLWPFLVGRYPFALDAATGPWIHADDAFLGISDYVGPSVLISGVVQASAALVGADIAIKAALIVVVFAMGRTMHEVPRDVGMPARVFAGTLYVVNPFTYVRLIAGQWLVLFSLAGLAMVVLLAPRLWRGEKRAILPFSLASLLLGAQVQFLFFALLVLVPWWLLRGTERARNFGSGQARAVAISAACVFLVNSFWIVPLAAEPLQTVAGQTTVPLSVFAPKTRTVAWPLEISGLGGFWRDSYVTPIGSNPIWFVAPLLLIALSAFGLKNAGPSKALALGAAFGGLTSVLVVALAAAGQLPASSTLPSALSIAFRDSHKLLALTLFSYCLLGGFAMNRLVQSFANRRAVAAFAAIGLLTMGVAAYPMVAGYDGQVGSGDFPASWYEAARTIDESKAGSGVLVFPWHLYMDYHWAPGTIKRLANPAPAFFRQTMIAGDNLEAPGTPSTSSSPVSKYIETLLRDEALAMGNPFNVTTFGNLVSPLGVGHVVLFKETDWFRYWTFLVGQRDLLLVYNSPEIAVFENLVPVAPAFSAMSEVTVETTHDLVNLSEEIPLNSVLVRFGPRGDHGNLTRGGPAQSTWYMGSLSVRAGPSALVVMSLPQESGTERWKSSTSQDHAPALGFLPVAKATNGVTFTPIIPQATRIIGFSLFFAGMAVAFGLGRRSLAGG